MLEMIFVGGVVGVVVAVAILLFAVYRYQRRLNSVLLRQEGWERAQEIRQQQWELQQERHANEAEKNVTTQVQQIQEEWQTWVEQDATRIRQLQQQYEDVILRGSIEYELAHLPQTGDAALPLSSRLHESSGRGHIARLSKANLSGRDLSRRYLVNADLRGTNLANANLFMADLSGACLVNANLSGADLSGANLADADLRNATLVGANLLVTDMNNAILPGADLRGAHGLTMSQLNMAIYDKTTHYNVEPEETQPRVACIEDSAVNTSVTHLSVQPESASEMPHSLPATPPLASVEPDIQADFDTYPSRQGHLVTR